MSEPRLKSGIWIQALVWRCGQAGVPATILRRGDADAGAVLLKIRRRGGAFSVLAQSRSFEGALVWSAVGGGERLEEPAADAYIDRQVQRDPDLWVIEIEDAEAERFLDAKVI